MRDLLAKTPVRVALVTVGTAAVAAGSFLIGKQQGAADMLARVNADMPRLIGEIKEQLKAELKNEN